MTCIATYSIGGCLLNSPVTLISNSFTSFCDFRSMATMSIPVQPESAVRTKGFGIEPASSPPTRSGASITTVCPFTNALNCILPIHCVSISCCAMILVCFSFVSVNFKWGIQRAKANEACQQEYCCQYHQHNAESTRYDVC